MNEKGEMENTPITRSPNGCLVTMTEVQEIENNAHRQKKVKNYENKIEGSAATF